MEYAVKLGPLATVKIENMRKQHSEILEGKKEEAVPAPAPVEKAAEPILENPVKEPSNVIAGAKNATLSVAAGEGVEQLFGDLGGYLFRAEIC